MNTFKRKSLYAALAGVSALGAAGAAQAVNVNPDGLGQVLIYPYYTVRTDGAGNAFNTLLSVVNTTASSKAVKVRFLEGKDSREVIDFNLFLSPYDVWTAALLANATGTTLKTTDKSCTLPAIPAAGVSFVNFAYTGSAADNADTSLDRTREGYFEIIEMGAIKTGSVTDVNVTHVAGVPPGCASVTDSQASTDTVSPIGGLMGTVSFINVTQGSDYTADPTALDAFFVPLIPGQNNYGNAGTINPDLTTVTPKTSLVFTSSNNLTSPVTVQTDWSATAATSPVDAVSAVLMHDNVLNEYTVESVIAAATDWVITMPTKRYYVKTGTGSASPPFQRNFNGNSGSCDDIALAIFDREEQTTSTPLNFSPPPPTQTAALCWEANVLTFNAKTATKSNVLGSTNVANLDISGVGFQNGWLKVGFPVVGTAHRLVGGSTTRVTASGVASTAATSTYFGLPTIGFAVESYSNGTLPGTGGGTVLSNYGGNWTHKYTRNIQ